MTSLADLVTTESETVAPRIVLYGVHGIGKSTFGASLPKPIFLRTEDGMKGPGFEGVARMPLCTDFEDIVGQLTSIEDDEHTFKSLVVDSVDWMEQIIQQYIVKDRGAHEGKKSIAEFGFQSGYNMAATEMKNVLNVLSDINRNRNMMVCLLGHAAIKRFEAPDSEPYDRYGLALHKYTAPLVYEWADLVLFVNYKTFTRKSGDSFGKDKHKGIGQGERVIYTEERPSQHAKNRYALPYELPFDWKVLKKELFGDGK